RLTMRPAYLFTAIFFFTGFTPEVEGATGARQESYRALSQWTRSERVEENLPDKCGLPVLSAALHDRTTLSPALQRSLQLMLLRPSLDTSIVVGNYRIHYDTTGVNAPAMLDASYRRIPGSYKQYV